MGLKLKAENGGGSVELDVPSTVNSDLALTVPATAGEIVVKDSSGKVGIGTSSPQRDLHIHNASSSTNAYLQLTSATTGTGSTDGFQLWAYGSGGSTNAAIVQRENAALEFWTSNTERMRIDSDGNVSIGSNTASSKLHVVGGSLTTSHSAASSGSGMFNINTESNSQATLTYDDGNSLVFGTASTPATQTGFSEKMRLTSNGELVVGSSAAFGAGLTCVKFNGSTTNGMCLQTTRTQINSSFLIFYDSDGTTIGHVTQNSASTTLYSSSSDYRLKENVVEISDGISRVKQLKPSRFNFIKDPNQTVDGFIAHEAQAVVPEAVVGEKDGEQMQGIDQSKIVPLLTAALKEAIGKIETLETKVATLEAK